MRHVSLIAPVLAAGLSLVDAQLDFAKVYAVQPSLKTAKPVTTKAAYTNSQSLVSSVISSFESQHSADKARSSAASAAAAKSTLSTTKSQPKTTAKTTSTSSTPKKTSATSAKTSSVSAKQNAKSASTSTKKASTSTTTKKATSTTTKKATSTTTKKATITTSTKKVKARAATTTDTACQANTIMYGAPTYVTITPSTPSAFPLDSGMSNTAASNWLPPAGYSTSFINYIASNNAQTGVKYLTYNLPGAYNTSICAKRCDGIAGCNSFNIYFQRTPKINPNATGCPNPQSVVDVHCAFFGDFMYNDTAVNYGLWENDFLVTLAGVS